MRTVPLPLIVDNHSDIITIPLSKGLIAMIDADDGDMILPHPWHASKSASAFYARSSLRGPLKGVQMHRHILNAPRGMQVDHINGDTLDNRRDNLRVVTGWENMRAWADRHYVNKSSRFTGVYRFRRGWTSCIYAQGKSHYLGSFRDEVQAAIAYDDACEKLRGCRVNFP